MRLNLSQYSLPSATLALVHENSAGLDQLRGDLRSEHQPINTTEELLVNEIAEQYWRLRRARAMETDLLASGQTLIPHLAAIQRMMSSAERGFHKALTALRQLQKDRRFVPANSEPQQNRDSEGAAPLTAERSELSAPSASFLHLAPQTKTSAPPIGLAPSKCATKSIAS